MLQPTVRRHAAPIPLAGMRESCLSPLCSIWLSMPDPIMLDPSMPDPILPDPIMPDPIMPTLSCLTLSRLTLSCLVYCCFPHGTMLQTCPCNWNAVQSLLCLSILVLSYNFQYYFITESCKRSLVLLHTWDGDIARQASGGAFHQLPIPPVHLIRRGRKVVHVCTAHVAAFEVFECRTHKSWIVAAHVSIAHACCTSAD